MKNRRIILVLVAILIFALIGFGAALIGQSRRNTSPSTTPDTSPNTSTPEATAPESASTGPDETEPKATTYPVKVYFSKHPESDDDPARTFPVNRTSPDVAVGKYVVEQLLAGPNASEKAAGYFSTVRVRDSMSNCNNKDFSLSITNGTATLRFCRTFDALGTVSDGQAKSTITDSLMQFSSVKKVIILTPEGHCQFDMSGEDRCLQ